MGQSKRRGTFEERLKQAVERRPLEEQAINRLKIKHPVLLNESNSRIRGRLGFAILASIFAAHLSSRPLK